VFFLFKDIHEDLIFDRAYTPFIFSTHFGLLIVVLFAHCL